MHIVLSGRILAWSPQCHSHLIAALRKGVVKGEERVKKHLLKSLEKEMATHPLQYSCLENPMDGETWWATVHGIAKSQKKHGC